jgi:hypothetical protein
VAEHERAIGRDRKSGWGVTYIARVGITIPAGHGIDGDLGLAYESALCDKQQRHVSSSAEAATAGVAPVDHKAIPGREGRLFGSTAGGGRLGSIPTSTS